MNLIKKIILSTLLLLLPSLLISKIPQVKTTADENALAVMFTIDGEAEEKYNALVEKHLPTIDFKLTDPHKRVNDHYKTEFGSTVLDVLSFMPIVNDKTILPLLNIDPRIAGFAPFNMLIEKKLDEQNTHVGHLMPKVMLDILGITNKEVREKFTASFKVLDEMIAKELGGEKQYLQLNKLPEQTMMNFEYSFDIPEEIDDFIDDFQERFETALTDKKYLVAGYHNFMDSTGNAADILKNYDAFWTYSLCHMEFSYNVFDKKGARPDAGLFAPCTMYMFIPKGSGKLIIGMYRLHNWSDTLGIEDPTRVSLVEKLDKEIPEILLSLGAKETKNFNPLHTVKSPKSATAAPLAPASKAKPVKDPHLAKMYILKGDAQKAYNKLVETELPKIGFNMADPHHRVNDQYKEKYGSTQLDVLSFLPAVNDNLVMKLFNTDPRLAGFSPFNMLIYKKLSDKDTHAGHLMPEAMLDILGVTDPKLSQTFIDSFKPLDALMERYFKKNGLSYTVEYIPYNNVTKQKMFNYEYTFERPEDIDDFIEEFQNKFELAFIDKNYLIAGFHNFMDNDDAEEALDGFDAFWSYSLCHLSYSYNIFDNAHARPDAGLFAPCTMYVYIKKDDNKLTLGMPTLANVKNTLKITDPKRMEWMDRLDREIPQILSAMGMKAVENTNPLKGTPKPLTVAVPAVKTAVPDRKSVSDTKTKTDKTDKAAKAAPSSDAGAQKSQKIENGGETIEITIPKPPKVPSVLKVKTTNSGETDTRAIKFSKRVPPNYITSEQRAKAEKPKNSTINIGEVTNGKISTYLRGKFMDVKSAEKKLKDAGFTVLSTSAVDKKKELISIVFTDKTLTDMGSKKETGFMASLRLLVNKKDNHISITNPLYMAKAFMRDQYNEQQAKETLKKITVAFKELINSKDQLKFQLLPKYQFMNGMPQYQDMVTVGKGSDLLAKLKNNKNVVFTQKLNNGAMLVGVKLGKRTSKFTSRIGTNNAALLPYPLLIENGEAKILEPKYYISVMYPLLQMSEFMTIATVPGAIVKDCMKIFR